MRAENDIFATFANLIEEARDYMGIPKEWLVLRRSAQNMMNEDEVILIDKISQRRKGFQDEYPKTLPTGETVMVWEWIEEWRFQVSAVRTRRLEDTPETLTSDDVAMRIRAWINSGEGAERMREEGMAPLFVFDAVPSPYTDENDVYQYYTHFDVSVQAVQTFTKETPVVDSMYLGIKHVPLCPGETTDVVFERIPYEGDLDRAK